MQALTFEQVEARRQRGRELVAQGKVLPLIGREGSYVVLNGKGAYLVSEEGCTCPDYQHRAVVCKHQWAVQLYREAQEGGERECRQCGQRLPSARHDGLCVWCHLR